MKTLLAACALVALLAVACGAAPGAPAAASGAKVIAAQAMPLPGASGNAFLDCIAYERGARRVWVPIGSTGSVDVLDTTAGTSTRVDGFDTVQREARGQMRVCAIDVKTLKLGACVKVPAPIDGVVYVAATKEVWVTAPHDGKLFVLDAVKPAQPEAKMIIPLAGEPKGYAIDESRGDFYARLLQCDSVHD